MPWRPASPDPARWNVLYQGVPSWLEAPLLDWVQRAVLSVATPKPTLVHTPMVDPLPDPISKMLQEFDLATRRETSAQVARNREGMRGVRRQMTEEQWFEFVDFLVYYLGENSWLGQQRIDELSDILARAGSELTIGERDGGRGLVKRVPEGVARAAQDLIESEPTAGVLLAEAWNAMYGRDPDQEEAYEKAIKAVEEAGARVVSPNNVKATLGTMIRDMKAQGDWKLGLPTPEADVPVRMADALWAGQESRHGGNGYRKPTQLEAEAAVMLAVPLVQWFVSGGFQRRP